MLPGGGRSCTQLCTEGRKGQTCVLPLDHSTQSWSLSSQMSPASPPHVDHLSSHLVLVTRSQIQAPCSGKPGQGQDQAGAGGVPRPHPAPSVVVTMSSFTALFLKKGKKTFCTRAWMLFPLSASKEP